MLCFDFYKSYFKEKIYKFIFFKKVISLQESYIFFELNGKEVYKKLFEWISKNWAW